MLKKILSYGAIAGLIAGGTLSATTISMNGHAPPSSGLILGYTSMLIALSVIFIAIKRQRDREQGGVIGFWPAFGMGIGISVVAGILYVAAWEFAVAVTGLDFPTEYAKAVIAQQQAKGASAEAIAKLSAEMAQFKIDYAKLSYRLPMTFAEIFPVGLLVSLVSAGLLRNSRFMPARRA